MLYHGLSNPLFEITIITLNLVYVHIHTVYKNTHTKKCKRSIKSMEFFCRFSKLHTFFFKSK